VQKITSLAAAATTLKLGPPKQISRNRIGDRVRIRVGVGVKLELRFGIGLNRDHQNWDRQNR